MTMLGTGLLWFGWFGFNGGSALAADEVAATAFVATHLGAKVDNVVFLGGIQIGIGCARHGGLMEDLHRMYGIRIHIHVYGFMFRPNKPRKQTKQKDVPGKSLPCFPTQRRAT